MATMNAAIMNIVRGAGSRLVAAIACLLVLSPLVGCGGPKRADYSSLGLVNVTGTVRLDGAPLAGATVVFENEDLTFSQATTDSAGRYRLMFNSEQPGIAPGTKKVRISSLSSHGDAAPAEGREERVPARYNTQSQETVEVTSDQRTFDFDVQSTP